MNEQIKKLEFTDWFYYFMTELDDLFDKLTELKVVGPYDFPRISMLYLNDMFWGSEVWVTTKNCKTQEEYNTLIKQLSEEQLKMDVEGVLEDKGLHKERIKEIVNNLNINFCIN